MDKSDWLRCRARRIAGAALLAGLLGCAGCRQQGGPSGDGPATGGGEVGQPAAGAHDGALAAGEWVECVPGPAGEWQQVAGGGSQWRADAGIVRIPRAEGLAGVRWTGAPPSPPFEVELEARRIDGSDFFCGLTVPTRSARECVTLIVGGWGGALVGISSLDDMDASENQTALSREFETGRWYRLRLRFSDETIGAWIDGEQVIDVATRDRRLSLRPGPIDVCSPFGLATWETSAELRSIRWRRLPAGQ